MLRCRTTKRPSRARGAPGASSQITASATGRPPASMRPANSPCSAAAWSPATTSHRKATIPSAAGAALPMCVDPSKELCPRLTSAMPARRLNQEAPRRAAVCLGRQAQARPPALRATGRFVQTRDRGRAAVVVVPASQPDGRALRRVAAGVAPHEGAARLRRAEGVAGARPSLRGVAVRLRARHRPVPRAGGRPGRSAAGDEGVSEAVPAGGAFTSRRRHHRGAPLRPDDARPTSSSTPPGAATSLVRRRLRRPPRFNSRDRPWPPRAPASAGAAASAACGPGSRLR